MKQEEVLHEKQKTKMRHKNISREHLSFTNFDPKLRAKTGTDSKFIKLLNDFCCTKTMRIFMCRQDYENKKLVITKFSLFFAIAKLKFSS